MLARTSLTGIRGTFTTSRGRKSPSSWGGSGSSKGGGGAVGFHARARLLHVLLVPGRICLHPITTARGAERGRRGPASLPAVGRNRRPHGARPQSGRPPPAHRA